MIVGSGMMAGAFAPFRDDQDVVIFASGVADSLETRPGEFSREKALLAKARREHAGRLLVYFGTCSVEDSDRARTPYVLHKIEMESLIEESGEPWMVLRVPLAVGPDRNGHTLAPFLYQRVLRGERFEVWEHATRYPIDVADVLRIARRLIATRALRNHRINIALRAFPVLDFVRVMESIVGRPALFDFVPKGKHYPIHCPEIAALAPELSLDFSERYLDRILHKYFADR